MHKDVYFMNSSRYLSPGRPFIRLIIRKLLIFSLSMQFFFVVFAQAKKKFH